MPRPYVAELVDRRPRVTERPRRDADDRRLYSSGTQGW